MKEIDDIAKRLLGAHQIRSQKPHRDFRRKRREGFYYWIANPGHAVVGPFLNITLALRRIQALAVDEAWIWQAPAAISWPGVDDWLICVVGRDKGDNNQGREYRILYDFDDRCECANCTKRRKQEPQRLIIGEFE